MGTEYVLADLLAYRFRGSLFLFLEKLPNKK
jgi:hypothetical protein